MIEPATGGYARLRRAKRVSPTGLAAYAVLLSVLFAACHGVGLREYTTVLSGTVPGSVTTSVALGMAYVLTWFASVVLVPILVLGAVVFHVLQRVTAPREGSG